MNCPDCAAIGETCAFHISCMKADLSQASLKIAELEAELERARKLLLELADAAGCNGAERERLAGAVGGARGFLSWPDKT
jgi:hypothetical protein